MNTDTDKRLVTPRAVMAQFEITRPTLNQWVRNGVLEKIQIPGSRRVYITSESLNKILKSN